LLISIQSIIYLVSFDNFNILECRIQLILEFFFRNNFN